MPPWNSKLWTRWVIANALGEMFGLGLTLTIGAVMISRLGGQSGATAVIIAFLVAVASGAIEATIVGLAQWWSMNPWFPGISRFAWWLATLVGALLAYVLGYLPSTMMSLGEETGSQVATTEPVQWVILLLAAALGIVGGAVLSFAQWLTMRKTVRSAGIWIPANMLAWMVGMPLVFWGIDLAQKASGLFWTVLSVAAVLFFTGLVVGAIHGAFLTSLALPEKSAAL